MNTFLRFLAVSFLTLSSIVSALGQELDMDCRPVTLPTQCQNIQSEIETIEANYEGQISALRDQLEGASPTQRPSLRRKIDNLNRERTNDQHLKQLKLERGNCRRQFDAIPRRPLAAIILNTNFAGNVTTNTSHPEALGPFNDSLVLGLQFSQNRCVVTITSFPPITFDAATKIGSIRVTVSKVGGGTGNFFPVTGQFTMPLNFLFDYATILTGDDSAATTLTTGSTISIRGTFNLTGVRFTSTNNAPVDQCGITVGGTPITCTVTLVGTTVFQKGFLGGNEGSFVATGTISVPRPPQPQTQTRLECLAECQEMFQDCVGESGGKATAIAQCTSRRTQCRAKCPAR
jgi:hypothetical protein